MRETNPFTAAGASDLPQAAIFTLPCTMPVATGWSVTASCHSMRLTSPRWSAGPSGPSAHRAAPKRLGRRPLREPTPRCGRGRLASTEGGRLPPEASHIRQQLPRGPRRPHTSQSAHDDVQTRRDRREGGVAMSRADARATRVSMEPRPAPRMQRLPPTQELRAPASIGAAP
jgi:hypothetical protein